MQERFEEAYIDFPHRVRYRIVAPEGADRRQPRPVLVALHGMGMSAAKFHRVLRHLEISEMLLVIPEGIYPFERRPPSGDIDTIEIGYAWYLYRGDQSEFYEHLERSEAHLLRLLDHIESEWRIDRRRSVLLGFSQGGYLAGFVALRHTERFGGLVIASARLKHEFLGEELRASRLPKTLFLHSEQDTATRWEQAKVGLAELEKAGANVTYYLHDAGHRLPPDALIRLGEWLGVHAFDSGRREAAQVKAAWSALEAGDPERALELVTGANGDDESPVSAAALLNSGDPALAIETRLVVAIARLDLAQCGEAHAALVELADHELDADTEYLRRFYLAQACYHLGMPGAGLDCLFPLEPEDPLERANVEWWKGLCHDLLGQNVRADACFARMRKLDPHAPDIQSLTTTEVERMVDDISEALSIAQRSRLAEHRVVVADVPPRDVIRQSEGRLLPDLLVLSSQHPAIDRTTTAGEEATIYVYRRNLERFTNGGDATRRELEAALVAALEDDEVEDADRD